jgi:hypothetical protein
MREIQFLLNHKETFIKHICGCYPFSEDFIEKYKNYINWDFLSINEKLPWSISFIEKFYDLWNWESLSGNESLPWSDELIIKFPDKWKWNTIENYYESCLMNNDSIKWTRNIIFRFPEKFSGEILAQNTELLNLYPEILDGFKETLWWDYISGNEYMNWSEELIDRFIPYWNWEILSANREIGWNKELIEKYKDKYIDTYVKYGYPELWINEKREILKGGSDVDREIVKTPYTTEEFEDLLKKSKLSRLSYNKRIPWNEELLSKYHDEWDWGGLSTNGSLPWSGKLIDKFLDKWDFGTMTEGSDGSKSYTVGLSSNSGLPWSRDLIKKYESKWDWMCLTYSDNIPWSLEILEEFETRWDWGQFIWNETMWKKVFYPYLDEEVIGALITIINKKVYPF